MTLNLGQMDTDTHTLFSLPSVLTPYVCTKLLVY
jgi:hypothetical protein